MKAETPYSTDVDLALAAKAIQAARRMWADVCEANMRTHGDEGSCVIGAGIACSYLPKRCKYPRRKILISSDEVSRAQGSLNWERGIEPIIAYLQQNGIPSAYYECGRMD